MSFKKLEQFLIHTDRHRENVSILSEEMLKKVLENKFFLNKYNIDSQTNIEQLKKSFLSVIRVHDKAKMLDSPKFLKQHNLEEPFYKFLYKNVGKVIDDEGRKIIDKMNKIDELVTTIALHKHDIRREHRELFFFVEYISDIVERGCNPLTAYELGREVDKASSFKRGYCNMHEFNMILELEDFYEKNLLKSQKIFADRLLNKEKCNIDIKRDINRKKRFVVK